MKTLVVYYSLTGNTKFIADALAKTLAADLAEIKPKHDDGGKGLLKMFWRGKQAVMKEKPELLPMEKKLADYDLVVLGSPVWASSCSPALYSFVCANDFTQKNVAIFVCHGGALGKTFENLRNNMKGAKVISEIDFIDPLFNTEENCLAKAIAWAEKLPK